MTDEKPVLHLSPSVAVHVLRSARHGWRKHSNGGGEQDEASDLMRRGKLFDRLLFGGKSEVVVVDKDAVNAYAVATENKKALVTEDPTTWQTNAAKAIRAEAEAAGNIAVLRSKHDEALVIVDRVRALLLDRGIDPAQAKVQHRIVWESNGVPCKGFLDLLFVDEAAARIYDLKIVDDASEVRIDARGSIQAAAYVEAVETLNPELAGRVTMQFLVVEADGGDMRIGEPDGQLRALGAARWRRAVATWGECLKTGVFPGYPREVVRVEAKPWDFNAEMDAVIPAGGSPGIDF